MWKLTHSKPMGQKKKNHRKIRKYLIQIKMKTQHAKLIRGSESSAQKEMNSSKCMH